MNEEVEIGRHHPSSRGFWLVYLGRRAAREGRRETAEMGWRYLFDGMQLELEDRVPRGGAPESRRSLGERPKARLRRGEGPAIVFRSGVGKCCLGTRPE